ncbi:MAG TPA: DUF5320 family protein [Methanoregula sp.]|nr:DUF5320 family protein [Methanoregula sp.]
MPDFDGTGPLKRGRVIGRGRGPCKQQSEGCSQKNEIQVPPRQGAGKK